MGWESARSRLPRPLTPDEAITDLRWWERQVRFKRDDPTTGRPMQRMPGRARLVREWGWDLDDRTHTPNHVRKLLGAKHLWMPPGTRAPESTSEVPAAASANANNEEDSTSEVPVPAKYQPSASPDTVEGEQSAEKHQQSTSEVPGTPGESANGAENEAPNKAIKLEITTTTSPLPPVLIGGSLVEREEARAVTDAQRRLLQILRRWTDPHSKAPHPWAVDWGGVLEWWAREILTRDEYRGLDYDNQLERWDNSLERAALMHGRPKAPRFPKNWKNSIHSWLTSGARYARKHTGQDHDHTQSPRRATTRRRGQESGSAGGLFDISPFDAGGG